MLWLACAVEPGALGLVPPAHGQAVLSLDPELSITQYRHDVWSIDNGLPQDRVNALAQTPDGHLWLGTQEGLVRFDGQHFQLFDKQNSGLQSNVIAALNVTRSGDLWIGTRGGGLSRLSGGKIVTYREQDGLNSDHVSVVEEDADGVIWVGTTLTGISRLKNGELHSFRKHSGLESEKINTLYADRNGNVWIGTRDAGLIRYRDGRFFPQADGLPSKDIVSILQDRHGDLWFGTRNDGLCRLKDGRLYVYTTADGLPSNAIEVLLEDAAGTLWIGTDRGGLSRFSRGRFSTFSSADGLSGDHVMALLEDHEGGLWVATETGGVNQLRTSKFTPFTTREGLALNGVYSITEDVSGAIWFGTRGGGVSRLQNGRMKTIRAADGLSSDYVLSVYGARDGGVWIGTQDAGLNYYRDGEIRTFSVRDGLPENSIYSLLETSTGVLYAGTGNSGLVRYHQGLFSTLTTKNGLSSNSITAIAEGAGGNLWVGTYDAGLNEIVNGRVVRRYTTDEGLPSDFVTVVYQDEEGYLWISTRGGGISRLRDGELRTITMTHGLHTDNIAQIFEDSQANFWMSSNRGLLLVRKADLHAVAEGRLAALPLVVYDRGDGLLTTEFTGGTQPAGWKSRDGRFWFSSTRGAVSVDPLRVPLNPVPPPVDIQMALAKGEPMALDGTAVLAPGFDRVEFHYAGLSYMAPEDVRYRYRLVGIDDDWVDAGARREAFYTSLAPGRYTFEVMASNNDGVWSRQTASVSFYLKPFFYQTPWFYLLCALGLAFAGVGMYALRVRRLKARQRELEGLVEERTADLRNEKEKTERAKTLIEAQAEQLRVLDQMKTRFFSNISHEFRTPLTLNIGPLENALSGVYGPLSPTLRGQVEVMLRNARRLLRLINQLLDLSKLDSGKMKLKVMRRNLTAFVEGVVLSFTPFTEKKNLNLTFNTSESNLLMTFDPEGLEKVFFNLLSNAVKFTPEGGVITVRVARARGREGRAGVEIHVVDSGCGIPAAELTYIFDRFHQVNGTVSQVQQGTGIGLALVKELVELHQGAIRVESVPGEGSTFVVWLPEVLEEHPSIEPLKEHDGGQPASRGPMVEMAVFDDDEVMSGDGVMASGTLPGVRTDTSRATLLVVDDNTDVRDYVKSCLEGRYSVVTAVHGRDGLEKARQVLPDLVVSDVMMPFMDGYELCRAIRADVALQHLPVILLTSKASIDDKIEGLEAGADDYLAKPFNAQELLARVDNLLKLRSHEKALQEAIEEKSQVLRIAAHDLRNPLNSIREFAKIIREQMDQEAEEVELLDLIENASNHMLQLISQMLEAEALESGSLDVRYEPLQLSALARKIVERNRRQAEKKEQRLHVALELGDASLVSGNPEWLGEAIENLVGNAIKYSPIGMDIWITVERRDSAVVFAVKDEGPGLSDEDQKLLFKKFQRLSPRPTAGEASTGLGLSIVKRIVDMHAGRVWAESEVGRGSTFAFELPTLPEPQPLEDVEAVDA